MIFVHKIDLSQASGAETVYNIDVEEFESFYVNGVLVHQKCGGGEETFVKERVRDFLNSKGEAGMSSFEAEKSGGDE